MSSVYGRFPRNGKTAREAAERVGMSVRTAQRWTSQPREVYLTRAARRQDEIRALKQAEPSLSMRAIAARLGCSVGTVHRALSEALSEAPSTP